MYMRYQIETAYASQMKEKLLTTHIFFVSWRDRCVCVCVGGGGGLNKILYTVCSHGRVRCSETFSSSNINNNSLYVCNIASNNIQYVWEIILLSLYNNGIPLIEKNSVVSMRYEK